MEKRTRNALIDWVTKIFSNLESDNIKETSSATHNVESLRTDLTKLLKLRDVDLKRNYDDVTDPNIGKPSLVGKAKANGKRDILLSFNSPESVPILNRYWKKP